jgi:hypothetical protein
MDQRPEIQTTFRWRRDASGYGLFVADGTIRRTGGKLVEYDPAVEAPNLHREFADLLPLAFLSDYKQGPGLLPTGHGPPQLPPDFDPKPALLGFVNKYGFLGADRWGADVESESVDYLIARWREIAGFLRLGEALGGKQLADLEGGTFAGPTLRMCLEVDDLGHTVVRYRPESLCAWLWLRVADDLTSGIRWDGAPCLYCLSPMGRGPGGHRPQAKFCSDNHRTNFNRLPAAKQKELRAKARELQRSKREAQA